MRRTNSAHACEHPLMCRKEWGKRRVNSKCYQLIFCKETVEECQIANIPIYKVKI